jgi:hypothetical protein
MSRAQYIYYIRLSMYASSWMIVLSIQIPMNDPFHVNGLISATHLMMICLLHLLDILTRCMLD